MSVRRKLGSRMVESAILGASGLIAISIGGLIVYAAGIAFNMDYLSTPFIDEMKMLNNYPLFFVVTALIKIVVGGKIIELSVKILSRILGIREIVIAPDKPIVFVKK